MPPLSLPREQGRLGRTASSDGLLRLQQSAAITPAHTPAGILAPRQGDLLGCFTGESVQEWQERAVTLSDECEWLNRKVDALEAHLRAKAQEVEDMRAAISESAAIVAAASSAGPPSRGGAWTPSEPLPFMRYARSRGGSSDISTTGDPGLSAPRWTSVQPEVQGRGVVAPTPGQIPAFSLPLAPGPAPTLVWARPQELYLTSALSVPPQAAAPPQAPSRAAPPIPMSSSSGSDSGTGTGTVRGWGGGGGALAQARALAGPRTAPTASRDPGSSEVAEPLASHDRAPALNASVPQGRARAGSHPDNPRAVGGIGALQTLQLHQALSSLLVPPTSSFPSHQFPP